MLTSFVPLNQSDATQSVLKLPTSHPPANLPVPNPTKSFWIDSAPDANPFAKEGSEGTLTSRADICIIGSGITGVSAAYHLSQAIANGKLGKDKSIKAVILEARDFCSGATGRNGGHLIAATYKKFRRLQETYGTEQAIRSTKMENHTVEALLDIIQAQNLADAVDLAAWGHNDLFLTEKEAATAEGDLNSAKEAGVNVKSVEILDEQMMNDRYGTPYPGYRFPSHNLWPLKLVTELYKLASGKSCTSNFSLTLHTRTPVTSITLSSPSSSSIIPRRYTVNTPRGSISCSYIIHATNAYASHLLPHFTGPAGIIPNRGQVIALRAAVGRDKLGMAGWVANEIFEYWFPMPAKYDGGEDGNPLVILGGGREATAPRFELYEEDDSVINEDVSRLLKDFLPNLFKGRYENGREPEMEWSGIIGRTTMGDPFVGPVLDINGDPEKYKGQFISAGYSGHGMPRAFGCAEVVVDMIICEITGMKWSLPDWLPERYLTWNRVINKEPEREGHQGAAAR